jgi:hypothetical protein
MQQWEYAIETPYTFGPDAPHIAHGYEDTMRMLQARGKAGWELIAVAGEGLYVLIFKRPVQ